MQIRTLVSGSNSGVYGCRKKYERFCDRLINIGEKFAPYCKVTIIWDRENLLNIKDSPFDKGKEIFERLYKEREEINMRLLN